MIENIIEDFLLTELLAARVIISNKPEDYQKITLNNTVICFINYDCKRSKKLLKNRLNL
jgi:hypothetical protein